MDVILTVLRHGSTFDFFNRIDPSETLGVGPKAGQRHASQNHSLYRSVKWVARETGYSQSQIRKWIRSGKITALKIGGRIAVDASSIRTD